GESEQISRLGRRAQGHRDEADIVESRRARTAFDEVRAHRDGRAPNLSLQSKPLLPRKRACGSINFDDKIVRKQECFQLSWITHAPDIGLVASTVASNGFALFRLTPDA